MYIIMYCFVYNYTVCMKLYLCMHFVWLGFVQAIRQLAVWILCRLAMHLGVGHAAVPSNLQALTLDGLAIQTRYAPAGMQNQAK